MNSREGRLLGPAAILSVVSFAFSLVLLVTWVVFAINPNPGQEPFNDWLDGAIPVFIFCLACSLVAVGTAVGAMVSSGVTKKAWLLSIAALVVSLGPWITLLVFFLLPC